MKITEKEEKTLRKRSVKLLEECCIYISRN